MDDQGLPCGVLDRVLDGEEEEEEEEMAIIGRMVRYGGAIGVGEGARGGGGGKSSMGGFEWDGNLPSIFEGG